MPKNMLLKANLLVCLVIITGFIVAAVIGNNTNRRLFMENIEQISTLASDGIYYRLEAVFAKPLNISLTMAVSPLLKDTLLDEADTNDYIQAIRRYLNTYKEEYGYDSVFLVSAKTGRYFNHKGVDRVLRKDNPENVWYYSFLESGERYSLNVDNDEAAGDEITIFVNCRIVDKSGATIGVVGVGFRILDLQSLLEEYATEYNSDIYVINTNGGIEIAVDKSGHQPVDFFDLCGYPQLKDEILAIGKTGEALTWWLTEGNDRNFVMARFIPELNWYLIVEHNTAMQNAQINRQFFRSMLTAIVTGLLVLFAITYVISRYNRRIIMLTAAIEHEKQVAFRTATEQLYDNIYELNITKNYAISDHTKEYFESLGIAGDTPYSEALKVIAQKNVKEEYREGYVFTFGTENVLREFEKGNTSLIYDLLTNAGSEEYYWLRIMAHIYYRKEDDSVCMFTYRKNIEEEKHKDAELTESRFDVMLSQIQPHFLHNTLLAIHDLNKRDHKAANDAIFAFSEYLRGNMESIYRKKPILFKDELRHVETYLSLEKLRFEENLNYSFDVDADTRHLYIPALTLQPIVENAVRHGVTKREQGGTITISAKEIERSYIITVTDDGVGFDPALPKQDERTHVGIENTRSRLSSMCNGTIEIQSEPGIGTTAVITIPKEAAWYEHHPC